MPGFAAKLVNCKMKLAKIHQALAQANDAFTVNPASILPGVSCQPFFHCLMDSSDQTIKVLWL
jgi:hypothetical protein